MKFLTAVVLFAAQAAGFVVGGQGMIVKKGSGLLQDIVTYDEHSLMVYGQRIMIFSGEFHAYRLPVPDLWLDVFQKIKALGFSGVSFYVDWALVEGKPGNYTAEGVFALEPFFEAAQKSGIYIIARPGPYINAEVSGGGFPGWLQRIKGKLRTDDPDYLAATDNYAAAVGKTIAKYQITNGGPVILFQPENEYTGAIGVPFPNPTYFGYVEQQFRNAGLIVPFVSNDAFPQGIFAPGTTTNGTAAANVDIYGFDSYPLGFDCSNPTQWRTDGLPLTFAAMHQAQSPASFNSINEFQSGAFDPWGGSGFDKCAALVNMEFERVFYKNNFAARLSLLNAYMTFGGTNWGNLGHSGGYTSYDYGAPITENREVHREKYSELKLQGNFLRVSPAYLTASVGNLTNTTYTDNSAISVTPLFGNGSATNFYIVRHSDYQTLNSTTYKMKLKTSQGSVSLPQLDGNLSLNGRDSKWAVTDYDLGGSTLLYSTAEIFTWKKVSQRTILVVYGGPGEQHELAVISESTPKTLEGSKVTTKTTNGTVIINWQASSTRRVVQVGNTFIYILDRNGAYNYWTSDFSRSDAWESYTANIGNTTSVIVQAGYLVRNVSLKDASLFINGDLNATVPIKVLGAPASAKRLFFNGQQLSHTTDPTTGEWSSTLKYRTPTIKLPDLSALDWKYIDNLPEIKPTYDDSKWTAASHNTSNNPTALLTPSSLYASDYGFHSGALIYRGHFVATGNETSLDIWTQGGYGFGSSVWLNQSYIGSWKGADYAEGHNDTYTLPNLIRGKPYVFTVVVDNNGLDGNWIVGYDAMKTPRGIISYLLGGSSAAIAWKLTGNLGGESYLDQIRGPLNEGGLFAERQGYHQPSPPSQQWASIPGGPMTGFNSSGIGFYSTSITLSLPLSYDIPLAFVFGNTTINNTTSNYQAQLYINGWQFGKYINNVGPQKSFPVPQGILNYQGKNWIGIELWSRDARGARLSNFSLSHGTPVLTSLKAPRTVKGLSWTKRENAY